MPKLLVAACAVLCLCPGAARLPFAADSGPEAVVRRVYLMGTSCTLTAYATHRQEGLRLLETAIRVLERTDEELSTWKPESVLSRLNRQRPGVPLRVTPEVIRLFAQLRSWSDRTGGAFDPAVGALVDAWGLRGDSPAVPSPGEIEAALERTGLRHVDSLPEEQALVRRLPVTLDAGAFGKGEGLDRAAEALRDSSTPWMIDFGGQVAVRGTPPGEDAWVVRLAHPRRRDRSFLTVRLTSGSLATSGGSERDRAAGEVRVGHILDPRTGRPAPFAGSVSVWHPRALVADILSTALYVLGPEKGLRWAEANAVEACFLVPPDREDAGENGIAVRMTPGFAGLVDPEVR